MPQRKREWYQYRVPLAVLLIIFVSECWLESRWIMDQHRHPSLVSATSPKFMVGHTTSNRISSEAMSRPSREHEPLWHRLGKDHCRMPEFFDPTRQRYDLTSGSNTNYNESQCIDLANQRRQELKLQTRPHEHHSYGSPVVSEPIEDYSNEYYHMLMRKSRSTMYHQLDVQRNLTFVHIGKAGGSTLGCHLAEARKYVHTHCASNLMKRPTPLSALSLHVNCYTHWQGHMYCYNKRRDQANQDNEQHSNDTTSSNRQYNPTSNNAPPLLEENNNQNSYLTNVRNPVDRLASWFYYEHPVNHKVNYPERDYYCGTLILFSCYETWNDFVTFGLQPLNTPTRDTKATLRIGANLTQIECSQWAWAAVQGNVPASYHNFYNYDWYAHHMLGNDYLRQAEEKQKVELFVIRAEHLQTDWLQINTMLMGNTSAGSFNISALVPATLEDHQNSAQQKKLPAAFNTTTSRDGMANLCRALCYEIQAYMVLLHQAVNLKPKDVRQSLQELRRVCPNEASDSAGKWSCPQ